MKASGALLSLLESTVILDGCAQLLGSLIASFQTCAICVISGFTCVKHWEKAGCPMPLSWISDWRGYTSEVLQGILRLTRELMAFNTLLHFFGMWACLWVREMDTGKSWGHLIVVLLIWNQSLAAVRCKVCCCPHTDTVRGVLQACWILGITAESSAPRATDHAACSLREWDSTALLPASLRLCWSLSLRFQRPPYSIYVAFPCPSQGPISFPQCGRAERIAGEPVCAKACDPQEQQGHSSSLCWCLWEVWHSSSLKHGVGLRACTFCRPVSRLQRWMQVKFCVLSPGCQAHLLAFAVT